MNASRAIDINPSTHIFDILKRRTKHRLKKSLSLTEQLVQDGNIYIFKNIIKLSMR